MFFINARTLKLTAESCLSVPVIQTQLAFEITNGLQTSFMAETDLIQRWGASTLKWPQYKFTSSETHRPINKVHIYIYTSCFISILVAQDANVNVSLIAPIFRETRQTNAMTSQLLIWNRPIRWTIFRQEPGPICVQRFDDSLTRAIHVSFGSSSSMY